MRLPFTAYLLNDEWTLIAYEHGEQTSMADILRRLYMLGKAKDVYQPDYCFEGSFEEEMRELGCNDECSLSQFIVKSLKYLAKRYLMYLKGNLYVKKDMLDEWMEVVRVFPPLLIEAAFFLDDSEFEKDECKFFREVLKSNFASSTTKRPYNRNLEKMVADEQGLIDLHIHINGTAETDYIWWTQIGNVEKWIFSFKSAWNKYFVRMQREQLTTVPLNDFVNRIRAGKKLLNTIIHTIPKYSKGKVPFSFPYEYWHPSCGKNDNPQLAVGAYFYLKVLKLMDAGELDGKTVNNFHHLILILGSIHKMMVQQEWQKGFKQFQMVTENGFRWRHEEKNIESRLRQLSYDNDFLFLKHIEGRFSPKDTLYDNLALVQGIINGYESYKKRLADKFGKGFAPKFQLVAHFIKQKDTKPTDRQIRHREVRKGIRRKGHALYLMMLYASYKKIKECEVVGIDAAANEMDAGPEVFAPTFHWLRKKWRERKKDIQITFHAGEDFVHLLSGLRMMVEAVEFLDMEQGDRIGHGTAAGIEPSLWMHRIGKTVKMRKGEWLDDLIVAYHLISGNENKYNDLIQLLPKLHNRIMDLHKEIYGTFNSIKEMTDAWAFRKYDGDILRGYTHIDKFDFAEMEKVTKMFKDDTAAKRLYRKYHFDTKVKTEYNKFCDVDIEKGLFTAENLYHIQKLVLNKIAMKGVALEVLLTSNTAISFYRESKEHHLEKWLGDDLDEEGMLTPPIVVGSDDPGIFMTNIYIEYARIATYLEQKGYGYTERMHILEDLIKNGEYFKFGG